MATDLQHLARTLLGVLSVAGGTLEGASKEPPVGGLGAASISLTGVAGGH